MLIASAALIGLRQVGWLDFEPLGFWPRWLYVWGLLAWALALLRVRPFGAARLVAQWNHRGAVLVWLVLDFTGRGIFWYQRPLHRFARSCPDAST